MRKRNGFTLFEAMVSVVIFSTLMLIIVRAFDYMQKAAFKAHGKNDANSQIVRLYNEVNRNMSVTNANLFRSYMTSSSKYLEEKRWFAFPIPGKRRDDGLTGFDERTVITSAVSGQGEIGYSTLILYFIHYKQGCCGGYNSCPHKVLYKTFLPLCTESGTSFDHNKTGCPACSSPYGITMAGRAIRKLFDNGDKISSYMNVNRPECRVVETDILNLELASPVFIDDKSQDLYFTFTASFFRIEEAKKLHFDPNGSDLIHPNEKNKRFIEKISWTSVPEN